MLLIRGTLLYRPLFLGYYSKFRPLLIQKGEKMDITKTINEMKKEPGFADNVGTVLVHKVLCAGGHAKTGVMLNILMCPLTMK